VLGYNMSQDDEKNISAEQKKFDNKFIIGVSVLAVIAVALVVADMNYLHVGYLVPIGFAVLVFAIVANLVKGNIDWRRKKAREASGEITSTGKPKYDVEAAAATVPSLKAKKRDKYVPKARSYTADDLQSEVVDEETIAERKARKAEEASLELLITTSVADSTITGVVENSENK